MRRAPSNHIRVSIDLGPPHERATQDVDQRPMRRSLTAIGHDRGAGGAPGPSILETSGVMDSERAARLAHVGDALSGHS